MLVEARGAFCQFEAERKLSEQAPELQHCGHYLKKKKEKGSSTIQESVPCYWRKYSYKEECRIDHTPAEIKTRLLSLKTQEKLILF